MNENRILVTGCAGFVGSMVVAELLQRGYRVRGYDNLSLGGEALLSFWSHPNFEFVRADVRDRQVVRDAITDCYGIVHLAAIVGDPACSRQPELARETNLRGSLNVVEAASATGVERFIFASTCSNYGKMPDPERYVDETSELRPISLYAETKVAVEKEILTRQSEKSPCYTCLRFATVYGVSPRMRFDLTVNQFAMEMAVKRKLVVYGEQFWRPYIHVRDMARAVAEVLGAPAEKVRGEVFNVGSTEENYTKQMIVGIIRDEVPGGEVEYVHKDDDPRDYRVSFEKIRKRLEFVPSRRLRDGVREVLALMAADVIKNPEDACFTN